MTNFLNAPAVRKRFGITDMTLYRWLKDEELKFPQPIVVRRRRLFSTAEIEAFEARLLEKAA